MTLPEESGECVLMLVIMYLLHRNLRRYPLHGEFTLLIFFELLLALCIGCELEMQNGRMRERRLILRECKIGMMDLFVRTFDEL